MAILKLVLAFSIVASLGLGIVYAVNRVGELNVQATMLEACAEAEPDQYQDCPDRPIAIQEIIALRNTANTVGSLGWVSFFTIVFGAGGTVFKMVTEKD